MFEKLAGFDVILVAGPQRSGTTICARMVAHDLGYRYVDEEDYGPNDEAAWRQLVRAGGKVAVQCPAMCHLVHEFAQDSRVAVVLMRRDVRDIIESQERIGWTEREEARELAKYTCPPARAAPWPGRHSGSRGQPGRANCAAGAGGAEFGPVSLVKYDYWDRVQRFLIPAARRFEIEYESLAGHPLWVPRAGRVHFGHRQTAP